MRMEFTRLLGDLWFLDFETPSRRDASAQRVSQDFEEGSSLLSLLEILDAKIGCVKVTLRDMDGLAPRSDFLDTLCAFLRGREIAVHDKCLQVFVVVAENVVDRSDAIVAEATSKICCAVLENQCFRASSSVVVQVPVTPSQDVMDRFFIGRESDASPQLTLRVGERPPGSEPDALEVKLAGSRLFAEGLPNAAALADTVLKTTRPAGPDPAIKNLRTLARHRGMLGQPPAAPPRPRLQGFLVSELKLEGLRFSEATVHAVQETMAASSTGNATADVSSLTLEACVFVDRTLGFGELAAAMSRSATLRHLHLLDSPIEMHDMRRLCDMLASSEWSLKTISVGGMSQYGEKCISDDCARVFFQRLPSMKTLETLDLEYMMPGSMFQTAATGIRNNYSLRRLGGLKFTCDSESSERASERVSDEIHSCLVANGDGRGVVHAAVSDPDNRALQKPALDLIHSLSSTDDLVDLTSLFLCLQLILPACTRVETTPAS